jgi:anti-anti-sigma regulatory factor
MTPAKIFQLRSHLTGLFNHHEQRGVAEEDINMAPQSEDVKIYCNSLESASDQTGQQESLIEIGPRLDIQAGIDLINSYKNISSPTKAIRIDLQGAQTAHGAVIQTLLVIQKTCKASGSLFAISGISSELLAFFHLAGLNELLVNNQEVESL